mmetsp:Transcript_24488/g.36725  ORF Transcript_24488/g.36725 Transcript_24488/m.36725 type:complete len:111 (+) Transcript_24488:293-625(+)
MRKKVSSKRTHINSQFRLLPRLKKIRRRLWKTGWEASGVTNAGQPSMCMPNARHLIVRGISVQDIATKCLPMRSYFVKTVMLIGPTSFRLSSLSSSKRFTTWSIRFTCLL